MVERCDQERHADREEQQPLDDAQRTGIKADDELQVVAEGKHARADEKANEIADSAGKEKLDHEGGA